jgi:hypothetical protein
MRSRSMICGAAALTALIGCRFDSRDRQDASVAAQASLLADNSSDVVGTYVAADSGNTLGKNWCYSGALVLDSTGHFGSVLTMCSDEGAPVTEHLKGTYHLRTVTTRGPKGAALKALDVVLNPEGKHQTHSLRYAGGALRFDEPWWLGAGLRALEIPDPLLKKVAYTGVADSTAVSTASSTQTLAANSKIPTAARKHATRSSAPK